MTDENPMVLPSSLGYYLRKYIVDGNAIKLRELAEREVGFIIPEKYLLDETESKLWVGQSRRPHHYINTALVWMAHNPGQRPVVSLID